MTCGIYCIENVNNKKRYIGQSVFIEKRLYNHKYQLSHNKHSNPYLQSAWNKYGDKNFKFYIQAICNKDELDELEKFYIDEFETLNNQFGYNQVSGGSCNRIIRDSTRIKMSNSQKGKILSKETKDKMSKSRMGIPSPKSDEQRIKISKSLTGRTVDRDVVEKIRDAVINRPKIRNSTSRFRGVSKYKHKWDARIKYKKQLFLLGTFQTEIQAAQAYNDFVIQNGFPHPLNIF